MFSVFALSRRPPQWSTPSTWRWQTSWLISLCRLASCSTTVEEGVSPAPTCTFSATLLTCTAASCFWPAYVWTVTLLLCRWVLSYVWCQNWSQLYSLKPKQSLYNILHSLFILTIKQKPSKMFSYVLAGWSISSVEEFRSGQMRVCVCLVFCHRGHLLFSLHCIPANRLLHLKAALSYPDWVLSTSHYHCGLHLEDRVGPCWPPSDATKQV